MLTPITSTVVSKGLCPHGLPFAACPICSGKSGGGASAVRKEMTWDECYAIGQRMKAQAQRTEAANQYNLESLAIALQRNKTVQLIVEKMVVMTDFIQQKIFQPVANFANRIFNFASRVFNFVASPIVSLATAIYNSPVFMTMKKVAENIQKGFSNISDKIASVLGEYIMTAEKVASEIWKKIAPKKFIFFAPVDTSMEQGEQEEEVELKRWLHIKSFKKKIQLIFKKKSKDERKIKW